MGLQFGALFPRAWILKNVKPLLNDPECYIRNLTQLKVRQQKKGCASSFSRYSLHVPITAQGTVHAGKGDEGSDSAYERNQLFTGKNAITQLLATINRKQMYTQSIWKHLIRSLLARETQNVLPQNKHCNPAK